MRGVYGLQGSSKEAVAKEATASPAHTPRPNLRPLPKLLLAQHHQAAIPPLSIAFSFLHSFAAVPARLSPHMSSRPDPPGEGRSRSKDSSRIEELELEVKKSRRLERFQLNRR